ARAEYNAMRERMLRIAADFENFRKRSAREADDARRRGTQNAVRELLPVFDNLERASAHAGTAADVQSLLDGLHMVHKLFLDSLGKLGIERVAAVGQPFDPSVHDGIQHDYSAEHPAGTVMAELIPGYRMGTELLRPALVVVSRGAPPQETAKETPGETAVEPPPGDDQETASKETAESSES
ncbi:MAG TPA: nucleotide exchange factor GrpE, partial [Polyangiaceae bacterium]|nr:nucleotide exchange factor GrpE [Polyangiaceae bacterium]